MSKFSLLLRTIWKSTTSLRYYKEVYSKPLRISVKYYLWFSIIFGIILTLLTSIILIPSAKEFAQRFEKRAPLLFPSEAIIEIKDGSLSTNVSEPLRIPLPYEFFFDVPPAITDQAQIYFLTIDTTATPRDFSKSQSLIILTKNLFAIKDQDNTYQSFSLTEVSDTKIDKTSVDQFLQQLIPLLRWLPILIVSIGFTFFVIFLTVLRTLMILATSVVIQPIAKMLIPATNFNRISSVAFTAATLPTILQTVMYAFGIIPPIPFFYSILLGLFMLVIFADLKNTQLKK